MATQKDKIIWANVEALLKEKNWNYTDLAKAMKMTPQAVNSLKNSGIGSRSTKKLMEAFGVAETDLLKMDVPERRWRAIIFLPAY